MSDINNANAKVKSIKITLQPAYNTKKAGIGTSITDKDQGRNAQLLSVNSKTGRKSPQPIIIKSKQTTNIVPGFNFTVSKTPLGFNGGSSSHNQVIPKSLTQKLGSRNFQPSPRQEQFLKTQENQVYIVNSKKSYKPGQMSPAREVIQSNFNPPLEAKTSKNINPLSQSPQRIEDNYSTLQIKKAAGKLLEGEPKECSLQSRSLELDDQIVYQNYMSVEDSTDRDSMKFVNSHNPLMQGLVRNESKINIVTPLFSNSHSQVQLHGQKTNFGQQNMEFQVSPIASRNQILIPQSARTAKDRQIAYVQTFNSDLNQQDNDQISNFNFGTSYQNTSRDNQILIVDSLSKQREATLQKLRQASKSPKLIQANYPIIEFDMLLVSLIEKFNEIQQIITQEILSEQSPRNQTPSSLVKARHLIKKIDSQIVKPLQMTSQYHQLFKSAREKHISRLFNRQSSAAPLVNGYSDVAFSYISNRDTNRLSVEDNMETRSPKSQSSVSKKERKSLRVSIQSQGKSDSIVIDQMEAEIGKLKQENRSLCTLTDQLHLKLIKSDEQITHYKTKYFEYHEQYNKLAESQPYKDRCVRDLEKALKQLDKHKFVLQEFRKRALEHDQSQLLSDLAHKLSLKLVNQPSIVSNKQMKKTSPRGNHHEQDMLQTKEMLSPTLTPQFHYPTPNEWSFTQETSTQQLNFQDQALINYLFKGEITDDSIEDTLSKDQYLKPPFRIN